MGTMSIVDGRWQLMVNDSGSSTKTYSYTLNTSGNKADKDIRIVITLGSVCNISGTNLTGGNFRITTAGWYFPPNASSSGSYSGLAYTITLGKQTTTIDFATANKLINGNITISATITRTAYDSLTYNQNYITYFPTNRVLVNATSMTYIDIPTFTNIYFDNSGDIYVQAYMSSYSTSSPNVWNYGNFSISPHCGITRYGTGSPGSPYSYGGSAYITLNYVNYSGSSSSSSNSSSLSASQSNYSAQYNYGARAYKYSSTGKIAVLKW